MIKLSLGCKDIDAKDMVLKAISEKKALEKFRQLIISQKGDPEIIKDYSLFKSPANKYNYYARFSGVVHTLSAEKIGTASMILGAGREEKDETIDHSAGIYLQKKIGDFVNKGDLMATLYTDKKEKIDEALNLIDLAISYTNNQVEPRIMIIAKVTNEGVINYV